MNPRNQETIIREDPTINVDSTVALLKQIEERHPEAKRLVVIADNARTNRTKKVRPYLEPSKIEILKTLLTEHFPIVDTS